jgi:AhpD family alkylhydroperoxidase
MRAAQEAPLDVAIIGEMPPRITLIEPADAPILARPLYSPTGETSPITRALAQVPELLGPTMGFLGPVLAPGSIDLRTKELVILRVSAVAECAYCTGAHTVAAADAGVNAVEREALVGMAPLEQAFDGEDLRLLHLCDAIAAGGGVDGTLVGSVRRDRGDHGVVELVLLACATLMLNRLCTTLELPLTHATAERLAAVMEEIA